MKRVVKFRLLFKPFTNPSGRKELLEDALREFLRERRMRLYMSGLGGMKWTTGQIEGDAGDMDENDLNEILEWLQQQPVCCKAIVACPAFIGDDDDMFNVVGDEVLIDNLTDADRQIAAREAASLLADIADQTSPSN